ncbi:MAG: phosphatidate cytidylyltransferase [Vicinamibacterales bacterium]
MTRVISGAVLVVMMVAAVWFASPLVFFLVAEALLFLACREYVALSSAVGVSIPGAVSTAGSLLTAAAFAPVALRALFWAPVDTVLMTAMVAIGAVSLVRWRGEREAAAHIGAAVLPLLYLGLPIGAMIAIREMWGREALLLLMVTVAVSDTAQYYSGRRFGRRPLAPAISPKKTIEGALGGFAAGAIVMIALGAVWLTIAPWWLRGLLGMTLVSLGIAGDLFESMLKRSAGMKDSSTLIPGHGGVLDRIDALLFAAPIYYVVLKNL